MRTFDVRMLIKRKIILCLGSSCFARGNRDLIPEILKYISRNKLNDKVEFKADHCTGNCSDGPNIYVGSRLFSGISVANIESKLNDALRDLIRN